MSEYCECGAPTDECEEWMRHRIKELDTDNKNLERMLKDSLEERHKLQCEVADLEARLAAVRALFDESPQYQKRCLPDDYRPTNTMVYVEFPRDKLKAALENNDE